MSRPTPNAPIHPRPRGVVVAVGSLNLDTVVRADRIPSAGETVHATGLHRSAGGKSANQAVAAARLGARAALVGAVGDDESAPILLTALSRDGVDTTGVQVLPGTATGTALVLVEPDGENRILVVAGANGALTAEHIDSHRARLGSAGAVGLSFEVGDAALIAAARLGTQGGATVVLNPSPVRALDPELAAAVDLLVVNEHELRALTGGEDDAAAALRSGALGGIRAIVVTRGAEGADVVERQQRTGELTTTRVPSIAVEAVDTTGCGDAFLGALLAGLASGWSVVESARCAVVIASHAATAYGAQPSYPHWDEVFRR